MDIDYSEHALCDNCCVDYKKNDLNLYDIWIDGECIVTLCDVCINKMMGRVETLRGE